LRLLAIAIALAALTTAVAGSSALIWTDTETGSSCTIQPDQPRECTSYSRTLVEENGYWFLGVILAPVVACLAGFSLILKRGDIGLEWALAGIFFFICLVTIFTFGAFFILAAFLLLIATALDRRKSLP
jgi:hypothetical protein